MKKDFYCKGDWILEQVAQRDCTVPILAEIQNLTGQSPGQAALAESALHRLDHLWRSFPTSAMIWFCEWLQYLVIFFLSAHGGEKTEGGKKILASLWNYK